MNCIPNPEAASSGTINGGKLFWIDTRGGERPSLWVADKDGKNARKLFGEQDSVTGFSVFDEGRKLIVATDCGGDEHHQLRLVNLDSGFVRNLTSDPFVINEMGSVSPSGELLAFTSNKTSRCAMDVAVIDLATGTRRDYPLKGGWWKIEAWVPDNKALYVSEQRSAGDIGLFRLCLETGALSSLTPFGPARFHSVKPDGDGVLLRTDWGNDFLYIARLVNGNLTTVYRADGHDIDDFTRIGKSDRFAALINKETGHEIRTGAQGEKWTTVKTAEYVLSGLRSVAPAELMMTEQGALQPQRIVSFNLDTGEKTLLVDAAGMQLSGIAKVEAIRSTAPDGQAVPSILYHPEKPNGAAIMSIHGGPKNQWLPKCEPYVAELCARGVTVVAPNVRGSTGFGRNWAALDRSTMRSNVIGDMVCTRQQLIDQNNIDPARFGIMGRSYGGFMTALALGFEPALWASAAIIYGFADIPGIVRDFGSWRRPHRVAEYGSLDNPTTLSVLENLSPLSRLDAVNVPVFLYHGRRDIRVPITETEKIEAQLQRSNARITRLILEDEGHGYVGRMNREKLFTAVVQHFERSLMRQQ